MLQYIKVKSLFGLYSYTLDLTNSDGFPVKFITGPNGYGKTTLLYLASVLYSGNLDKFLSVVFEEIEFKIGDDVIKFIKKKQKHHADFLDDISDEKNTMCVQVEVNLGNNRRSFVLSNDDVRTKELVMYLKSLPYYYIKDQRLVCNLAGVESSVTVQPLPAVDGNADDMKSRLSKVASEINSSLQSKMSGLAFKTAISREDYELQSESVYNSIARLKKYGLMTDVNIYKYDDAPPVFLNAYLKAVNEVVGEELDFVSRLDVFSRIIERFGFVDKKLEISPKFGYRFRLKNDVESILSPSMLSSGEQHLLIMLYELLFKAQDGSIVFLDEPEMSFHLMWQTEFLRSLTDIVNVRNGKLQCLVATHSPQIFGNRWDLTVDLYDQNEKKH